MTIKLGVFDPALVNGAWFDPDVQLAGWWADELVDVAGGAISGSVSAAFTTSGTLTGAGTLAGSSAPSFTTAGALTGTGALSGSVSVAFSTAGTLAGTGALSGSATVAFDASGTLTGTSGQSLHGRRIRGRRVQFPDELDVVETVVAIKPVAIDLATPAKAAAEHKAKAGALLAQIAGIRRDRKARKAERDGKIAALESEYEALRTLIARSEEAERAHVARLRTEDEFWLLAA